MHRASPFLRGRLPRMLALAVLLLAVSERFALAHPHVWIYASVVLQGRERAVEALRVTWAFDEFYSALIAQDLDADGNGRLDAGELADLAQQSEASLRDYSFFTYLKIGGKRLTVDRVEDFHVAMEGGVLRYRFTVPVPSRPDPTETSVAFSLYDETFYVAVELDGGEAVSLEGDLAAACRPIYTEDEDNPIYFGMVYPLLVQIRCDGV